MKIEDRPTDMLQRQLLANREAARDRRDDKGRLRFPHLLPYRPHFVREMVAMRAELRKRGVRVQARQDGLRTMNARADRRG